MYPGAHAKNDLGLFSYSSVHPMLCFPCHPPSWPCLHCSHLASYLDPRLPLLFCNPFTHSGLIFLKNTWIASLLCLKLPSGFITFAIQTPHHGLQGPHPTPACPLASSPPMLGSSHTGLLSVPQMNYVFSPDPPIRSTLSLRSQLRHPFGEVFPNHSPSSPLPYLLFYLPILISSELFITCS